MSNDTNTTTGPVTAEMVEKALGALPGTRSALVYRMTDELNALLAAAAKARTQQQRDIEAAEQLGHVWWVEHGEIKHGPVVDAAKFGPHQYPELGTGDCSYGCGCHMGEAHSYGPVDPFGNCPKNPKPKPPPADAIDALAKLHGWTRAEVIEKALVGGYAGNATGSTWLEMVLLNGEAWADRMRGNQAAALLAVLPTTWPVEADIRRDERERVAVWLRSGGHETASRQLRMYMPPVPD